MPELRLGPFPVRTQRTRIEAYKSAVSAMKALPSNDPRNWTNQASIHQNHCPHQNWWFLPWHRAHLFMFEEALRRSDPPRTANVTVPYWDWSALPSGKRYPKAFEEPGSVLNHNRLRKAVCRTVSGPENS